MGSKVSTRFKPRPAGIHSLVEKRPTEARSQDRVGTESPSQARMHKRLGKRLPLGGILGAIAGAIVGALIGLLFFDRSAAILTSILASAVFGLGVGMLMAGYSSLESPDPGAEPSDTERPIEDRPQVMREEHPDTPAPN
jgi:predicted phage tail protein